MTITSGFYDSVNGDRKYSSADFGSLFEGVITEGVFAAVGQKLFVRHVSANRIAVESGKAWIAGRWVLNDKDMNLTVAPGAAAGNRIDAVVLNVNLTQDTRNATVSVVTGQASASPQKPTMFNTTERKMKPLAYITVPQGATSISQTSIEIAVGTPEFPYVTSPISNLTTTTWDTQFREWFEGVKREMGASPVGKLDELARDMAQVKPRSTQNQQNITNLTGRVQALENRPGGGGGAATSLAWRVGFSHRLQNAASQTLITYTGDAQSYSTPASKDGAGDWGHWDYLKRIQPYLVGKDGRAIARLDPGHYWWDMDGVGSNITTHSTAGVYIWLPKIYTRQTINSGRRMVEFSNTKLSSNWSDYAFKRSATETLEGLWLPMFYMDDRGTSLAGRLPFFNTSLDSMWRKAQAWSNRNVLFGGAAYFLVRDLIYMLGKTPNSQAAFGKGLKQASKKPDEVVDGGMFWSFNNDATGFTKILHSNVLGSNTYCLWDPYWQARNNRYYFGQYYTYANNNIASYVDSGWNHVAGKNGIAWTYQSVLNNELHVPEFNNINNDTINYANATGDRTISTDKVDYTYAIRMGGFSNIDDCGINLVDFRWGQSYTAQDTCAAAMMFPPAGYTPYSL